MSKIKNTVFKLSISLPKVFVILGKDVILKIVRLQFEKCASFFSNLLLRKKNKIVFLKCIKLVMFYEVLKIVFSLHFPLE